MKNSNTRLFILFVFLWGILNLLQATFTPLHNDEAYYWMYSRYPAWAYFDHPPMIALFTGIGYLLIGNELGVRLLTVISQLAALALIWNLADKQKRETKGSVVVFSLLVILMPVLNVYGFIATPDSPLLLFSALMLYFYSRFIERDSVFNMLALGLTMAGLMYSKYHGGLLILLLIMSNLKLLLNIRFYAASLLALILYLPHIMWQVKNGFPSFQYHMIDRASGTELLNVPEYLMNQLVIHNPIFLIPVLWIIIRKRARDQFERSLFFVVAGFLIFFFASSFRDHVEPHWTSVISIPMVLILFNRSGLDWNKREILKRMAVFLLPLLLIARLAVIVDFLPVSYLKGAFHGTSKRMKQINEIAGNRPVVFTNSYQNPSQYTFHTGNFSHSLNNLAYRKTQYDLWNFEELLHGKEVLYVPHWRSTDNTEGFTRYSLSGGDSLYARVYHDFQSLQRECVIIKGDSLSFRSEQYQKINLVFFNPYPYAIRLDHSEMPVQFNAAFFRDGLLKSEFRITLPDTVKTINPGDTLSFTCSFFPGNIPSGNYRFAITSRTGCLFNVINSKVTDALVTD